MRVKQRRINKAERDERVDITMALTPVKEWVSIFALLSGAWLFSDNKHVSFWMSIPRLFIYSQLLLLCRRLTRRRGSAVTFRYHLAPENPVY